MPTKRIGATARPTRVVRLHEANGSSLNGWKSAVTDALRRSKDEVPTPVLSEGSSTLSVEITSSAFSGWPASE